MELDTAMKSLQQILETVTEKVERGVVIPSEFNTQLDAQLTLVAKEEELIKQIEAWCVRQRGYFRESRKLTDKIKRVMGYCCQTCGSTNLAEVDGWVYCQKCSCRWTAPDMKETNSDEG